jgi:hypothetical protein
MSWAETIFLKKFIEGNKKFVGGTSPILKSIFSEEVKITKGNVYEPTITIKTKLNGTLTLVYDVNTQNTNGFDAYIIVNKDGEEIARKDVPQYATNGYVQDFLSFNVEKNSIYSFYIRNRENSTAFFLSNVFVAGQVVDSNYYD